MKHNLMIQIAIVGMMISMWLLMNEKVNSVSRQMYSIKEQQDSIRQQLDYLYSDYSSLSNYLSYHEDTGHDVGANAGLGVLTGDIIVNEELIAEDESDID